MSTKKEFKELCLSQMALPGSNGISISFIGIPEKEIHWDVIGELDTLESLFIVSLDLTEVGEELGQLTNLKKLSFRECPITEVPTSIRKLKKLEQLVIQFCKISTLPVFLFEDLNLVELYCETNLISQLPDLLQPNNTIRRISVAKNKLECIPKKFISNFRGLDYFNIAGNPLKCCNDD